MNDYKTLRTDPLNVCICCGAFHGMSNKRVCYDCAVFMCPKWVEGEGRCLLTPEEYLPYPRGGTQQEVCAYLKYVDWQDDTPGYNHDVQCPIHAWWAKLKRDRS